MKPISRRTLLKLFTASLALAACQRVGVSPTFTPTLPATPTLAPSQTPPQIPPTFTPAPSSVPTTVPTLQPAPFILDAHEDIAWNALEYGRDPLQSALVSRGDEALNGIANAIGERVTGLAEWTAANIGIIFASLYVMPAHRTGGRKVGLSYSTPAEAKAAAQRELNFYAGLVEGSPAFRLLKSQADLDDLLHTRQSAPQIGLVLLMEGADPIQDPSELEEWQAAGLSIIGPAWAKTRYAGGNGEPGPLTDLGRQLLDRMASLNLILDLSHLSELACLEALDRYTGLLIASHANPRRFLPSERGLTDEMIRKIAAHDGVMGVVPVNNFLLPGWTNRDARQPISKVVEVFDYVAQLTGSARYVGLGTDYDGGFGPGALPEGMDTIADLPKITDALKAKGWKDEDVRGAMAGNFLRILRKGLV